MRVNALTYDDPEHDRQPHEVEGELSTRYVPTLRYMQHMVDGVLVDPATVRVVLDSRNVFCPTGEGGGVDPTCSPSESGGAGEGKWHYPGSRPSGEGTVRLFKESLGIPRSEMPQIRTKLQRDFVKWADKQGIKITKGKAGVDQLKPLQREYDQARVDAMGGSEWARKSLKPIFISSDNYILDGTHHVMKHTSEDPDKIIPILRIKLKARDAVDLMNAWKHTTHSGAAFTANVALALVGNGPDDDDEEELDPDDPDFDGWATDDEEDSDEEVENYFCPGRYRDPTCGKDGQPKGSGDRGGSEERAAPYSYARDLQHLQGDEAALYKKSFNTLSNLGRKIKKEGREATKAEQGRLDEARKNIDRLSDMAVERSQGKVGKTEDKTEEKKTEEKRVTKSAERKERKPKEKTEAKEKTKQDQPKEPGKLTQSELRERLTAARSAARATGSNPEQGERSGMRDILREQSVEDGSVKEHGMSSYEKMREVHYEGQRVMFPDNNEGIISAAATIRNLVWNNIPKALVESNKMIIHTSQRSKDDSHWEKEYSIKDFKSAATGGNGNIVIYNGNSATLGTIAHESGHNLAKRIWGSTAPDKYSEFSLAYDREGGVSEYGRTKLPDGSFSKSEGFAEACKMYVNSPQTMEREFPRQYAEVKHLTDSWANR